MSVAAVTDGPDCRNLGHSWWSIVGGWRCSRCGEQRPCDDRQRVLQVTTDIPYRYERGEIVGDHPWAGKAGMIDRAERTLVGWGIVVKLDDAPDVPPEQEAFIFEPKHWQPRKVK